MTKIFTIRYWVWIWHRLLISQILNLCFVVAIHLFTWLIREQLGLTNKALGICILGPFWFRFWLSSLLRGFFIRLGKSIWIKFKFSVLRLAVWLHFDGSLRAGEHILRLIVVHGHIVPILALDVRIDTRDFLRGVLLHDGLSLLAVAW